MRCDEFESRLNRLLDRRLPFGYDSPLLAHSQVCSHCADSLAAQQALSDALESAATPALSEDFAARVVARIAAASKPASQPTTSRYRVVFERRTLAVIVATATALLVALVPLSRWFVAAPATPLVVDASVTTGDARVAGGRRSLAEVAAESAALAASAAPVDSAKIVAAGNEKSLNQPPTAEMAASGALNTSDVTGPVTEEGTVSDLAAELAASEEYRVLIQDWTIRFADAERLESMERIPNGLRPIASSFSVAFDLLRQTLPIHLDETL